MKIYALTDENGIIRYVGQTKQKLYKRKSQHKRFALINKRNGYKDNWIRHEYEMGRTIGILELEECDPKTANTREEYWINFYRKNIGNKLTNTQPVGYRNYKSGKILWSCTEKKKFKEIAKTYEHNIKKRKQVAQYDLEGNFIKIYESITKVLQNNKNINDHTTILRACTGHFKQAYGYMWRFGKNLEYNIKPFYDPRWKRVKQYDLEGNFIKIYDKITEASQAVNGDRNKIKLCCVGKRNTHAGFKWSF